MHTADSGDAPLFSAQVTASVLNVRNQPDASGDVITKLQNGAGVQVFEEQNGWARIDAKDDRWVNRSFLQKVDAANN